MIPRRNDLPGDRGVLIVSYASHKKKAYSFFLVQVRACAPAVPPPSSTSATHTRTRRARLAGALQAQLHCESAARCKHSCTASRRSRRAYVPRLRLRAQSEYGDIYKVTLDVEGEEVKDVHIKYFDTVPPCASLAVLKTGFLFAASETGNHALYQFIVSGAVCCCGTPGRGGNSTWAPWGCGSTAVLRAREGKRRRGGGWQAVQCVRRVRVAPLWRRARARTTRTW